MDWTKTLATIAPTIATALGGPMAGMAVKMATSALGIEEDEKALQNAIVSGDPEIMLKLKQVEQDFMLKLEELNIERDKIHAKDRQSARGLFAIDKRPQILLSGLFIIGYFIIIGVLLTGTVMVPDSMKEVIILLLGILTREIPTIMQFWFGSSSGSKDKAVELDKLSEQVGKLKR